VGYEQKGDPFREVDRCREIKARHGGVTFVKSTTAAKSNTFRANGRSGGFRPALRD
jgi:hypothetical protein